MAQPINPDDVMYITVEGTNEGTPWAFTRYYLVTSVISVVNFCSMIADYYENVIIPAMAAELTDQWQAECASVGRVAPLNRNVEFFPWTPIVGAIATDGTPNDNSVLLQFLSDEVGPRNRGRMYVPGLPEASSNGGLLLGTKQAAWDAIAEKFADILNDTAGAANPVIFSSTAYGTDPPGHPAAVTAYTAVITSCKVVGNLASQRRRRYRRNTFG